MVMSVVKEAVDLTKSEGQTVRGRLASVTERGPFNGKNGPFSLLDWSFEIISGDFAGEYIVGSTDAELTNHSNNKYRNYVETLLGDELGVGAQLNTDDLLGLEADIVIGIRKWGNPERVDPTVAQLLPVATLPGDPPPF
jgi:hypothetical protein